MARWLSQQHLDRAAWVRDCQNLHLPRHTHSYLRLRSLASFCARIAQVTSMRWLNVAPAPYGAGATLSQRPANTLGFLNHFSHAHTKGTDTLSTILKCLFVQHSRC